MCKWANTMIFIHENAFKTPSGKYRPFCSDLVHYTRIACCGGIINGEAGVIIFHSSYAGMITAVPTILCTYCRWHDYIGWLHMPQWHVTTIMAEIILRDILMKSIVSVGPRRLFFRDSNHFLECTISIYLKTTPLTRNGHDPNWWFPTIILKNSHSMDLKLGVYSDKTLRFKVWWRPIWI